tara:strand:- start:9 stop:446 length:438 start_codon:yes stop_codon:yes gene_type:complete
MNNNIEISFSNFTKSRFSNKNNRIRSFFVLVSLVILLPLQHSKSEQIFLKCTGKYEINRGPLITPDWETSYLKINMSGLISTIDDKRELKKGRTSIRRNYYRIKYRDDRNRIKHIYKINRTHGTYMVKSPQSNRILIGTCEKGRG